MFFLGPAKIYFSSHSYFYYIILFAAPVLLLPLLYKYYLFRKLKKIGVHFGSVTGILLLLEVSTNLMHQNRGIHQFSYQLGSTAGPFRVLVQNEPAQLLIKKSIAMFPYSTQYLIYAAEDAMRVVDIKSSIDFAGKKSHLCPQIDEYECFKKTFIATNLKSPFNTTGNILMVSVGSAIVNKDKIKKKDAKSILQALLRIFEINRLVLKSLNDESRVENIIPSFPKNEIASLAVEVTTEIDKFFEKHGEDKWEEKFRKRHPELEKDMDESIIEAYFLKKSDNEMIEKFQHTMSVKMTALKMDFSKKMKDKTFTKELTKVEILNYKRQIEALN